MYMQYDVSKLMCGFFACTILLLYSWNMVDLIYVDLQNDLVFSAYLQHL